MKFTLLILALVVLVALSEGKKGSRRKEGREDTESGGGGGGGRRSARGGRGRAGATGATGGTGGTGGTGSAGPAGGAIVGSDGAELRRPGGFRGRKGREMLKKLICRMTFENGTVVTPGGCFTDNGLFSCRDVPLDKLANLTFDLTDVNTIRLCLPIACTNDDDCTAVNPASSCTSGLIPPAEVLNEIKTKKEECGIKMPGRGKQRIGNFPQVLADMRMCSVPPVNAISRAACSIEDAGSSPYSRDCGLGGRYKNETIACNQTSACEFTQGSTTRKLYFCEHPARGFGGRKGRDMLEKLIGKPCEKTFENGTVVTPGGCFTDNGLFSCRDVPLDKLENLPLDLTDVNKISFCLPKACTDEAECTEANQASDCTMGIGQPQEKMNELKELMKKCGEKRPRGRKGGRKGGSESLLQVFADMQMCSVPPVNAMIRQACRAVGGSSVSQRDCGLGGRFKNETIACNQTSACEVSNGGVNFKLYFCEHERPARGQGGAQRGRSGGRPPRKNGQNGRRNNRGGDNPPGNPPSDTPSDPPSDTPDNPPVVPSDTDP